MSQYCWDVILILLDLISANSVNLATLDVEYPTSITIYPSFLTLQSSFGKKGKLSYKSPSECGSKMFHLSSYTVLNHSISSSDFPHWLYICLFLLWQWRICLIVTSLTAIITFGAEYHQRYFKLADRDMFYLLKPQPPSRQRQD